MHYLNVDDLPQAGIFVRQYFLGADVCQQLCHEIGAGASVPAYINELGGKDVLDEARRRTQYVRVTDRAQKLVEQCFYAMRSELERYFSGTFGRLQQPQFLRYRRGDFFRAHQDASDDIRHSPEVRCRRLSLVVFLNRQSRVPEADAYCGGELTLFRVDDDVDPRLHIAGQAGLLVAFPPHVVHEVRPVTYGERYTVVTWYQGQDEGLENSGSQDSVSNDNNTNNTVERRDNGEDLG